jgi:hypothetical protein
LIRFAGLLASCRQKMNEIEHRHKPSGGSWTMFNHSLAS